MWTCFHMICKLYANLLLIWYLHKRYTQPQVTDIRAKTMFVYLNVDDLLNNYTCMVFHHHHQFIYSIHIMQ